MPKHSPNFFALFEREKKSQEWKFKKWRKKTTRLGFICLATKLKNCPKSHCWYRGTRKKKRRRLLSRDKQLIASDSRWHRSNPLNNTQCHSRYKPLIQHGDPAGTHQQFQPRSCSFQLQLMLTQIARHQSRAMQSISQHTQRSASVPFGCWLKMLWVNVLGGFCLVGFYLQHQRLFALLCRT